MVFIMYVVVYGYNASECNQGGHMKAAQAPFLRKQYLGSQEQAAKVQCITEGAGISAAEAARMASIRDAGSRWGMSDLMEQVCARIGETIE